MKLSRFFIPLFLLLTLRLFGADTMLLQLKVFPPEYRLYVDGGKEPAETFAVPEQRLGIRIAPGRHLFRFSADGYEEKTAVVNCGRNNMLYEAKLEKLDSPFQFIRQISTGIQPKSVAFTPDGKHLVTALLEDTGIQVFETEHFTEIPIGPVPEEYGDRKGFVEIAFVEDRKEMLVTQMTTGRVHVYDYTDFSYKGNIDVRGSWSKVVTVSPDESKAYIANWVSGNISVVDVKERKFLYSIPVGGTPRGMAFSRDGKYLYVCRYDNGSIVKIDTVTAKIEKTLNFGPGAKRHIVLDPEKNIFYASDMARHSVFFIDGKTDTLLKELHIDFNPNTIALSPDGNYLFISTRGKNHPDSYLIKGRCFGKIFAVDTEKREISHWFWGMNQPTGLAVSPDNRFLAYSNFLDYTIEVYGIDAQKN